MDYVQDSECLKITQKVSFYSFHYLSKDQKHHYYLQDLSNFGAKIQIGTWWKYWDIFKDFKTVWHTNLDTIIRKYWTKNIVYICPLGTLFLFVDIPICVVTNAKAMKWNKALKRLFYCFVHWKRDTRESTAQEMTLVLHQELHIKWGDKERPK